MSHRKTDVVDNKNYLNHRHDREGKRKIAAYFSEDDYRDFKILAAEELKSTDKLLHEAVGLLFKERNRPIPSGIQKKVHVFSLK